MNIQLKCQLYLVALITLTISSISIASEDPVVVPEGDKAGVEMRPLASGGAEPLKSQDADGGGALTPAPVSPAASLLLAPNSALPDQVAASSSDAPPPSSALASVGEPGTASVLLNIRAGDTPPTSSAPVPAVGGTGESAVTDVKLTASPLPPTPVAAPSGASGQSLPSAAAASSPKLGHATAPSGGKGALASSGGSEPAQKVVVVEIPKEKVTEDRKTTPLGVQTSFLNGESPWLESLFYQATAGKQGTEGLQVQRFLDLTSPYPIVVATILAWMESNINHTSNLQADGRSKLGINADQKVRIKDLFRGIGASSSSIVAALLFYTTDHSALDVLRILTRRGYMIFESTGTGTTSRYTAEGLDKFLGVQFGSESFEKGVTRGNVLYLTAFNTRTGQNEVLSNSGTYPEYKDMTFTAGLKAATATPTLFPVQYLPVKKDDGPFRDASLGADGVYRIYQDEKAHSITSAYQILSIGSGAKELAPENTYVTGRIVDRDGDLKSLRHTHDAATVARCLAEINDPRTPLASFTYLQLQESQLGEVDDFSPAQVAKWVELGLRVTGSAVFARIIEQLGFKMPEPNEVKLIEDRIRKSALYDLQSRIYDELPQPEKMWLRRVVLAMTMECDFTFMGELSCQGRPFESDQKLNLFNAVAMDISRDTGRERWNKAWSTKELPLVEGIYRGFDFAELIHQLPVLDLAKLRDGSEVNLNNLLRNFVSRCSTVTTLFRNASIDEYTGFLTRIYWSHMLKDVKYQTKPNVLRQFQRNLLERATANLGKLALIRNSREWKLASDLASVLDDLYGPADSQ